jgi:parallel beta-helix repeat protein
MNRIILLNLVLLLVVSCPAEAVTITVKADGTGDYPTIQAAIDAAVNGDELVAEPGTYTGPGNRDIDFLGKAITVRSTDPNDPNIVAATIIDCNGTESEPHRGFKFHNGEDANSILNGLTIINAYDIHSRPCGGGISCYQSSPTIINCHISNNSARRGGGIYCYDSSPTITNCTFSGNTAFGGVLDGDGGGMFNSGSANLANILFINNRADSQGGGFHNAGGDVDLRSVVFTGNVAYTGAGVCNVGRATVANGLFVGNIAKGNYGDGGGWSNWVGSEATLSNCTLFGNQSQKGKGGALGSAGNLTVRNCIIWGNSAKGADQIGIEAGSCTVQHTDIQGGPNDVYARTMSM